MNTEQYFHKGKFKLETIPHEMRMSHWVYAPVLIDVETNTKVIDLIGNIWDFRSATESSESITIILARYPDGAKEYELKLYPAKGEASINGKLTKISSVVKVLDAIV
ncbi:hypothetical protein [Bermanella sp. R86510]|uniref:hypothetical protein n=1 Tax=unclassified Bermanella TaxID=2627862 RepID=UPI0037C7D3BD